MTTPLRRLRDARKLTLEAVAEAIGTDAGNLCRIEAGKQKSISLAGKLVAYYKGAITRDEILFPEDYPAPKPKRTEARA